MGKTFTAVLNRFDGGIKGDARFRDPKYAQRIQNFDAHSYTYKLVPSRSSESGDASASTNKIVNFTYGKHIQEGVNKLFGLGVQSGTSIAEVFEQGSETTPDYTSNAWYDRGGPSAGARDENFFIYYKGYVYGARGGTALWRLNTTSPGVTDTWDSLTYTSMAQGLVHSKDDILYIPYNNDTATTGAYIRKWDNSTLPSNATALTLPADKKVTSICEYGNYLAIACQPKSGVGNSVVYLWDRDSSLTTLTESIDFGEGNLQIIEEIDGVLVGISYRGASDTVQSARITFRAYAGNKAQIFREFISEALFTVGDLPIAKQKINNKLYFLMTITLAGTKMQGLWKVGRVQEGEGNFSVTFDRTPNNDTALTSGTLNGFFILGDYVFISYISSSAYGMSKTDDQSNYSHTSYYETLINPGHGEEFNNGFTKKLLSVTALFETFPSGGTLTVGYKADAESSFTMILSHTTANAVRSSAVNVTSTGVNLPIYKEITFRITTTGAKVIVTGLKFGAELVPDDIYD